MNEQTKLSEWMKEKGINSPALAEQLNFNRSYIFQMLNGDRIISDTFKWRFAQVFGYEDADRLFGSAEAVVETSAVSQ